MMEEAHKELLYFMQPLSSSFSSFGCVSVLCSSSHRVLL
jgi:hypothetical protein